MEKNGTEKKDNENNERVNNNRKTQLSLALYGKKQKQPSRIVFRKKSFENMQQIYRRTFMMIKCGFNNVALQLYSNCTSASVFSCKFGAYFHNTFF